MSSSEDVFAKLLAFVGPAFAQEGHRQAVKLEIRYCPQHAREEPVRSWERASDPLVFQQLDLTERLLREIVEICEGHCDSFGSGHHRYKVIIHEHLGGRQSLPFALRPSFDGDAETRALMAMNGPSGGGGGSSAADGALNVLTQHSGQLMRINQQMHESSFRTLANLTEDMREENLSLRAENRSLRKQLEEAESNKMDREYQFAMAADKNARTNRATEKLLQLGTVIAAKIAGGGSAKELGAPDPMTLLLTDFRKSLRPEQIQKLMTILDQGQMLLFMQIMEAMNQQSAQQQQAQPNGAPPSQPQAR